MVIALFLSVVLLLNSYVAAADGDAGEGCISPGNTCTGGALVCEGTTCKTKAGQSCPDNDPHCVEHSTCTDTDSGKKCACGANYSPSGTGICIANGEVGRACLTPDNTCTGSSLVCEGGTCKTKAEQRCPDTGDHCVEDSTCTGTDGAKKCACDADFSPSSTGLCIAQGAAGGACITPSNTCSEQSLVCEGGVCKTKAEQSCPDSGDHCVGHSTCTGTDGAKKCACDANYSPSATGLCTQNSGGTPLFVSSWLLTGSVISLLLAKCLP